MESPFKGRVRNSFAAKHRKRLKDRTKKRGRPKPGRPFSKYIVFYFFMLCSIKRHEVSGGLCSGVKGRYVEILEVFGLYAVALYLSVKVASLNAYGLGGLRYISVISL